MNRFIQFNDETVDTKTLLLYERIGRALSGTNYLELTERKLFEFQPKEGIISMSVFWRHRSEEIMHLGRLSDIYLLTAGFWKDFSLKTWLDFSSEFQHDPLRKLAMELLLMLEEFRLMDSVEKKRPGTGTAFETRKKAYISFHENGIHTNMQQGYQSDALLNQVFITLHGGMLTDSVIDWGPINFDLIKQILQNIYDAKNTKDSSYIAVRIMLIVGEFIDKDLMQQYYAVGNSIIEKIEPHHYHDGIANAEKGEDDEKETIEEVFRSWHMETEDEKGIHLKFELEHGRSGKSDGGDSAPGDEDADVEEIGLGSSVGNQDEKNSADDSKKVEGRTNEKKAGNMFGKEHVNVVYEEKQVAVINEVENREKLILWREEQKPYVRSFVEEMKKRIELKQDVKRERLMIGRLSSKLTTLVLDERPKPFYRKTAPSVNLDAVFGLLVDGSASMIDKLDETKRAVLMFHDVLRELRVRHEISSYYEDANKASYTVQPNVFELMHTFDERDNDNGMPILSFDAYEDNRDGFAIRWMAKRLITRPEKHKFLLVFSDGEPSAFGYDRNGIVDTAEAVMEAEKRGISVIHLFLSTEPPSTDQKELFSMMFGNKTASSSSVEGFTDQTLRILRKLFTVIIR